MERKGVTHLTKVLCFAAMLAFVQTGTVSAGLANVNLVSQDHMIGGYVYDEPDPATYYTYGVVPISNSSSTAYGQATSSAGNLEAMAVTAGGSSSYWATASSTYNFYPLSDTIDFSVTAEYSWSGMPDGLSFSYMLADVDTGTVLYAYSSETSLISQSSSSGMVQQMAVDTEHMYSLHLQVYAAAWDGQSVSLVADILPEPSMVLLLGLGAAMVSGLRRKR